MTPDPDPIGDYALLSDSHGSALVSRGGSIDWACLPRFDRPSVFARILGPDAGHWRISSAGTVAFAMRACSPWEQLAAAWTTEEILHRLQETIEAWRSWSRMHQGYRGPYREMVRHSGRVLQAPTYAPTGGVVAAPTTSLPEAIAGTRNSDYRFCWVRDASLTLEALWVAACPDEAREFFDFFVTAAGGQVDGERALQVLYGVGGERHLPEQELGHLPGYRQSRPVRVGNGAWGQAQLDIYGELLSAADLLADRIGAFDQVTAEFLGDLADAAAEQWEEPDQGIWEVEADPGTSCTPS